MMFFNFLLKSVGFVERIVKWRFKCRVLFKHLSLFVARVKLQVLVTRVCMTDILSRPEDRASLQYCTAVCQQQV